MVASYEKCEASPLGTSKAITFAQPYIFITQFMVITSETLQNLICSFLAVSILSWVVLYNARAVGAVLLCLAAIDIDLLGLLWAWGLQLNSVTMISLVMAIGLVVDYLAHLVHCFMTHTAEYPDPRDRMAAALAEVGGAVALGGLTTFIGVLPLAFASSFIYRVFFRLFICIVGLGLIHGFLVIPVLVYLAYPSQAAKDDATKASSAGIPGEQVNQVPENTSAEHSTL
jgi:multidrug efflux pump subunit AcrB